MKKQPLSLLASVLVFLCAVVLAGAQEDMTHVDSGDFLNPERPRAVFRHDLHNEKAKIDACNTCHHEFKDGKKLADASSEDRRCSDCHGLKGSGKTPSLRKAFHQNCKGCHEKSGKGPVMCGECHRSGNR